MHPAWKILDLTPAQLVVLMETLGEPASHAGTLTKYIYRGGITRFEQMERLSSSLRRKLAESAVVDELAVLEERVSSDGRTRKALLRLADGLTVESTLMLFRNSRSGRPRRTVCVSSQVGCSIGCPFCATGRQGFERNLTPAEIIGQLLSFRRYCGSDGGIDENGRAPWLTNVVFMGMGEPLANYASVRQTIAILKSPCTLGLGTRQITLSTAGLMPQIERLARDDIGVQLAVSLHAANDALRGELVPVNHRYPLEQLMSACREYVNLTRRRIFFEYALFESVNDSPGDAAELINLLKGLNCTLNLISGNRTAGCRYTPSSAETAHFFQQRLMAGGIRAIVRASRGGEIDAGCGQLKSRQAGSA
jgi:23S rRNA (adenine2503-C2)-methyltransferase